MVYLSVFPENICDVTRSTGDESIKRNKPVWVQPVKLLKTVQKETRGPSDLDHDSLRLFIFFTLHTIIWVTIGEKGALKSQSLCSHLFWWTLRCVCELGKCRSSACPCSSSLPSEQWAICWNLLWSAARKDPGGNPDCNPDCCEPGQQSYNSVLNASLSSDPGVPKGEKPPCRVTRGRVGAAGVIFWGHQVKNYG